MNDVWLLLGRLAGGIGLLLCIVGAVARLTGRFWVGAFQTGTLLSGGIAALAAGCFFLLLVATRRER